MRGWLLAAACLLLLGLAARPAPAAGPDKAGPWLAPEKARELNRLEPRPWFWFFEARWCYLCKEMKARSLSDPEVIRLLTKKFWAVKVDVEKRPDLKAVFKVYFLPTTVILTSKGQPMVRKRNFIHTEDLLKILRGAAGD